MGISRAYQVEKGRILEQSLEVDNPRVLDELKNGGFHRDQPVPGRTTSISTLSPPILDDRSLMQLVLVDEFDGDFHVLDLAPGGTDEPEPARTELVPDLVPFEESRIKRMRGQDLLRDAELGCRILLVHLQGDLDILFDSRLQARAGAVRRFRRERGDRRWRKQGRVGLVAGTRRGRRRRRTLRAVLVVRHLGLMPHH